MSLDENFIKRKEQAVAKDLETAFSGYQRLVTQVNSIRTWTITIMSASLALLFTGNVTLPGQLMAVVMLALFMFLVLELRERSSMSFNKKEVLRVQAILMEPDQGKYAQQIADYEFRDLRLERITRAEKIVHLMSSLTSWSVIVWYHFWVISLVVAFIVHINAKTLSATAARGLSAPAPSPANGPRL